MFKPRTTTRRTHWLPVMLRAAFASTIAHRAGDAAGSSVTIAGHVTGNVMAAGSTL